MLNSLQEQGFGVAAPAVCRRVQKISESAALRALHSNINDRVALPQGCDQIRSVPLYPIRSHLKVGEPFEKTDTEPER